MGIETVDNLYVMLALIFSKLTIGIQGENQHTTPIGIRQRVIG